MLARYLRRRFRSSAVLAVLASTLVIPVLVGGDVAREGHTGKPARLPRRRSCRPLCRASSWPGGAVAGKHAVGRAATTVLAAGVATSVRMELNQTYAGMENEQRAISRLIGVEPILLDDAAVEAPGQVPSWRLPRLPRSTVSRRTTTSSPSTRRPASPCCCSAATSIKFSLIPRTANSSNCSASPRHVHLRAGERVHQERHAASTCD